MEMGAGRRAITIRREDGTSPVEMRRKTRSCRASRAVRCKWDYAPVTVVECYVEVAAVPLQDAKSSSGGDLFVGAWRWRRRPGCRAAIIPPPHTHARSPLPIKTFLYRLKSFGWCLRVSSRRIQTGFQTQVGESSADPMVLVGL